MSPIDVDVLVCGGGMAGTVAAIAAGRAGVKTVLIERWGFLGGAATAAAVGGFVGWETHSGQQVVRGVAEEIVQELIRHGGSHGHEHFMMSTGHRMDRVAYDTEVLKIVLDQMTIDAGVNVLFHASIFSVQADRRTVREVEVLTKAGLINIRARVVIDASGDLDVLARAGASFLALAEGETLQPATMMFRFGPVDFSQLEGLTHDEYARLARQGVEQGALARAALSFSRIAGTDDGWFNISRVAAVDATDPLALSAAEVEGRRQAFAASKYLTASVPGCENGKLVALAAQLGIRETRRIHGAYVLTGEDLRNGRRFPDTIAVGAYPIDIHPAQGTGLNFETFGGDHSYNIPLRCMIPRDFDNVLVAGRGISATHEAHASTRVMPMAMAIGQAAGVCAALMVSGNAGANEVSENAVRDILREAGAYLH
jgi:hypothetical protein